MAPTTQCFMPRQRRTGPMRLLAALLLLAIGFAGCAENAPVDPEEDLFDEPANVGSGLGVIRGVVVDTSIVPVPEATVTLQGGESILSSDDGAFQFVDVEPGNHFITIEKTGWSRVQQSVLVVADVAKPDIVRVMLEFYPESLPSAMTFTAEGFVQCGAGTPLTIHQCPGLDDQDKSQVTIPYGGNPDHVQVEVQWKSTQPAGNELYLISKICGDPCDWGFDGRFSEGIFSSPHIARTTGDNRTSMQLGVWASPGGPANGTGVALDQPFQVYGTFFYNIPEPDPEWSFIADGEYVP